MLSRKSSTRVTLVLIGVAALAGCGRAQEQRRDVYASREDCLADWNSKPDDCKPATEQRHSGRGFWYGPVYPIPFGYSSGLSRGSTRSIGSSSTSSPSRSSISRGGFGSSARSSGG